MQNPNDKYIGYSTIIFLISAFASAISGIVFIIHAVKNPTLTVTQNVLWFLFDTNWWIPYVVMFFSYLSIYILRNGDEEFRMEKN